MNAIVDKLHPWADLLGRALIATIFILAGVGKITGYAGSQAYMESMGVPGALLPLVILAELGGGIAILLGLLTRLAAIGLAVFCVLSALLFHLDFADPGEQISFLKNFAIAGGFLFLAANGPGRFSIDARWFAGKPD